MADFMFRLIIVLSVAALAGMLFAGLAAWIGKAQRSLKPPMGFHHYRSNGGAR